MNDTPKTIVSKDGSLVWNVVEVEYRKEGKRKINRAFFKVACSRCGYRFTATRGNLEARKACPGCAEKPPAVKIDSAGHCISICEIGLVGFVREYQDQHDVSEREAVRQFIEIAKVHLSPDDPIVEKLTEEAVNAKVRRLTGKKKDPVKVCGDPPQGKEQAAPVEDIKATAAETIVVPFSTAKQFSMMAISQLTRIRPEDPQKIAALMEVIDWCEEQKPSTVSVSKLHVIENGIVYDGIRFGEMAITQLERIKKEDPARVATLKRVRDYIDSQLPSQEG